jgi:tRNA-dihydrouridine synthase
MGFSVGKVRIDPPTVLAPMEGITDRDFRSLIRGLSGCGLTVTEFVSSEATRGASGLDSDLRPSA